MSDISIYGFVTSLSSLSTYAICAGMFSPVTFRPLVMTRVVNISMFCFILLFKLTLASSGMASFLPFVHSRLDGKLASSFTINSNSWFRARRCLLGSRFCNTSARWTAFYFSIAGWPKPISCKSPGSGLYHVLSAH